MATFGFRYRNKGSFVRIGDKVRLSKQWIRDYGETGVVVGLHGFVTVQVESGDKVDFDMRSISLLSPATSYSYVGGMSHDAHCDA